MWPHSFLPYWESRQDHFIFIILVLSSSTLKTTGGILPWGLYGFPKFFLPNNKSIDSQGLSPCCWSVGPEVSLIPSRILSNVCRTPNLHPLKSLYVSWFLESLSTWLLQPRLLKYPLFSTRYLDNLDYLGLHYLILYLHYNSLLSLSLSLVSPHTQLSNHHIIIDWPPPSLSKVTPPHASLSSSRADHSYQTIGSNR